MIKIMNGLLNKYKIKINKHYNLKHFVFQVRKMLFKLNPPPPLDSVCCYKSNTFYISRTL